MPVPSGQSAPLAMEGPERYGGETTPVWRGKTAPAGVGVSGILAPWWRAAAPAPP